MNLVRKIAENYRLPYYTMSPTYSVCKEHGYLDGEQYICPICGAKTEGYSRITGYYRPVQNWNDGKAEEFKARKTYIAEKSELKKVADVQEVVEEVIEKSLEQITLFTTKTCPNCKMAKLLLDKAGIKYNVIDAEENPELTVSFGVRKAPTLLVPNGNSIDAYENASNIKGYIESRA
jgi:ribonucleoside-triphosphate reductase